MSRKNHKIHCIYKTTCNVTGKYYIGMHSTSDEDDNYLGSGKRLRYSIKKYGSENHTREILEYFDNREKLIEKEKEIVCVELLKDDLCMNLCIGGQGGRGFTSEEQRLNAIKSNAKQKQLSETDIEWVKRRSKKISNVLLEAYTTGKRTKKYFHNWNNLKHSDDTKKLMSEKKQGKYLGYNNSQYGTCWITNGLENKKIKKDVETPEGWYRGRV